MGFFREAEAWEVSRAHRDEGSYFLRLVVRDNEIASRETPQLPSRKPTGLYTGTALSFKLKLNVVPVYIWLADSEKAVGVFVQTRLVASYSKFGGNNGSRRNSAQETRMLSPVGG